MFCGPGGMDQGFKNAGFTIKLAYDKDEACVCTHRHNHPESEALIADLSAIEVSKIINEWKCRSESSPIGIIGGPPCQSFSISNSYQNELDKRHNLPKDYARILDKINNFFNIDFFVFENVPSLKNKKHIAKFYKFNSLFEKAGFNIFEGVLDAQKFGVAQVRPRVFVVGVNKKKYPSFKFEFPESIHQQMKTVWDVFNDLPEPIWFSRGLSEDDIPYHPNHWCMVPRSSKFQNGNLKTGQTPGRSFRVLAWDKPSYTVAYGHMEVHIHPNCHRRLSVLEAMRLQGFPDSYVLKGTLQSQIRLVSEAVPPPVAAALAKALMVQMGYEKNFSTT
nr:DNA cytosine methyltransferase [Trichocoleus sp. FACHB-90]